jgi:hypothetical protein
MGEGHGPRPSVLRPVSPSTVATALTSVLTAPTFALISVVVSLGSSEGYLSTVLGVYQHSLVSLVISTPRLVLTRKHVERTRVIVIHANLCIL